MNVKNVEEPSTLTLNRLQVRAVGTDADNQVIAGSTVAAILNDPDGAAGATLPLATTVIPPTTLQWYVPKVSRPELENEDHWINAGGGVAMTLLSYTPARRRSQQSTSAWWQRTPTGPERRQARKRTRGRLIP